MKVAVLLAGCGIGDGSQIEEVLLTYLALESSNIEYIPVAPNRDSFDVIDHYNEIQIDSNRNILIESARIGKGRILPLDELDVKDFDGLIIIGGMGVYKNLSNYIEKRNDFDVETDVYELITSFYNQRKPIGSMCAGIILVVKSLEEISDNLSVGMTGNAFKSLFSDLNVTVTSISATKSHKDIKNKLTNTPAFLGSQKLPEIYQGILSMVNDMIDMHK